jgi:hypothetical protein
VRNSWAAALAAATLAYGVAIGIKTGRGQAWDQRAAVRDARNDAAARAMADGTKIDLLRAEVARIKAEDDLAIIAINDSLQAERLDEERRRCM